VAGCSHECCTARHAPQADGAPTCDCRKPRAGMLRAVLSNGVRGLMIGDRPEDRAAAEEAGIDYVDAAEIDAPTRAATPQWGPPSTDLKGPASVVWAAMVRGSPHMAAVRHEIREGFNRIGCCLVPGLAVPIQIERIVEAAWPVIPFAAADSALRRAAWFGVAGALGAEGRAASASLMASRTLVEGAPTQDAARRLP